MSFFLNDDDLKKLTGRKAPHAQIRILKQRGIPYTLDGNNKPVVVTQNLLPKVEDQQPPQPARPRLHFPKDERCESAKSTITSHAAST